MRKYNRVGTDNYGRQVKNKLFQLGIREVRYLISCGFDEEAYRKLIEIQSMKDISIKQVLKVADCFYKLGKLEESEAILVQVEQYQGMAEALDFEDTLNLLNLLGLVKKALKQEDTAMEYWRRCLDMNPTHNVALNNFGNIYMHKRNWDEATKLFWKSKKCRLLLRFRFRKT